MLLQPHHDPPMTTSPTNEQSLKVEIVRLKTELSNARAKLTSHPSHTIPPRPLLTPPAPPAPPLHPLLLLTDSALPLGSFAFSSGLESYLAHHPRQPNLLHTFLSLTLHSTATTLLPYLLAAYRSPSSLLTLDAEQDATTLCPVARRASIAQGRALLTLWERAFRPTASPGCAAAATALETFTVALRATPPHNATEELEIEIISGHFAPLWAVVSRAMGLGEQEAAWTFLFCHAKAVVSAGVRKGVLGPYAAQGVLGGGWLREEVEKGLVVGRALLGDGGSEDVDGVRVGGVEQAGQGVPGVDLWMGRHEVVYSRIFNS